MPQVETVEAFAIRYPEPNDFGHPRMTVIVRVRAAGGLTGHGEAIAMWPEACAAVVALIEGGLKALVIGRDAAATGTIWHSLKAQAWWYGEGGVASMAIAALDIALWDLRGKAAGLPIHALLGGPVVDGLPAMASIHVNRAGIAEVAAEAAALERQGFGAMKLGFGKRGDFAMGPRPAETIAATVSAIRDVVSPGFAVMVDVGNGIRLDSSEAIRLARTLEPMDVGWLEEPLHPSDIAGYRLLRERTTLAIGNGEREYTAEGYRRLLASGNVDVLGVDPARAEGITAFVAIAQEIHAARRIVNAHAWSTAITSAASLHASVTTPAARWIEFKPQATPVQDEIVEEKLWFDADGRARPPRGPGLGIAIREAVLDSYRV